MTSAPHQPFAQPAPVTAAAIAGRPLRYYDFVMAAFVTVLLLSNIVGAAKLSAVAMPYWPTGWWPAPGGVLIFGAGILFFPVGYVLGDVLTEVYGYARARRVIWTGFGALIFGAIMTWAVVAMPPTDGWQCEGNKLLQLIDGSSQPTGAVCQATFVSVFGSTWRIALASIIAFWAGEFVNSYVMARMKIWTRGRMLWTRTIGSTVVGQGVDSLIFYPIAFLGIWSNELVLTVLLTNWALKVVWEALLTPVTYAVVGALKRREGIDLFDEGTDFTPFRAKI